MDAASIGKWIVLGGLALVIVGAVVWGLARAGIPLGQLPGDLRVEGKNSSFYFPIVTCIVISIVLTVVLSVFGRWR